MPALGRLLEAARDAALEAGELLRQEFHRRGGPRGSRGHAPVDTEAERLIRERLTAALPEASYLGEELGTFQQDPDLWWVVDPNDGTAPFLKGMRGNAVSIALVREAVPVLGVIYAPTFPDDRGDLLTWAEGRPVERNGVAASAPTWPSQLDKDQVVLLSQGADAKPAANLRCCSPARFRSVPSAAYRLALCAVGEGVAGISCAPRYLDVAGAHAIVRGAGGVLIDQRGRPVTINSPSINWCFAGPEAICRELAGRPWSQVLHADPERPLMSFPVRLEKGRTVRDPGVLSRAQGCLLGQLAGDSLGGLVEFCSRSTIHERYPEGPRRLEDGGTWGILAGQPTDDSEMALALARSLVDQRGFLAPAVRDAYQLWIESDPFDVGGTVRQGLSEIPPNEKSQANGALMRCAPLALASGEPQEWGRRDAAMTHPHPRCQECSAAFLAAVRTGLEGGTALEMAERAETIVPDLVARARSEAPSDYVTQQGWVEIAFQNAFFQLLHAPSLEQALVDTVRRGGDTDTNAAIAGALLGALHGRDAVPEQWRWKVLTCRPHPEYPPTRRPRPSFLWPVDALALAERLLVESL